MKKSIALLILVLTIVPAGLAWWLFPENIARAAATEAESGGLKKAAYELLSQGKAAEAADQFKLYLTERPNDTQASIDYSGALALLGRHADAAQVLEAVHQLEPDREAAYFKLGVEYVALGRNADAAKVFEALKKSPNSAIAAAATESSQRMAADAVAAEHFAAEKKIYELAQQFKYEEVINGVNELEKGGELSFAMAMQRIYAYANQQKYAPALDLATPLAEKNTKSLELMLVRAELLFQLGRKTEAVALWEQVARENPDSDAAHRANTRLAELKIQDAKSAEAAARAAEEAAKVQAAATAAGVTTPALPADESVIYSLAEKRQHRDVIAAIDQLEQKRGSLAWEMEMQRLYALQAAGENSRAVKEAEKMAAQKPESVELAMMRSDMLYEQSRWEEASVILKDVRDKNPNTPVSKEAARRLLEIPAIANLDKWGWGESYMSGDYHTRFDSTVGYGYIRTGTYFKDARWLQPYVGFSFTVDTKSGNNPGGTIISDNDVGLYAGIRAQIFKKEYLFVYFQGGGNKDLLGRRHQGYWSGDYQAGIYGYKAYGPGIEWKQVALTNSTSSQDSGSLKPIPRGDWWVDGGADFSYYHRYASWLGYAQVREGLRLMQFGNRIAVDGYVMENFAWDVKGNYTDNLAEIGPGLRLVYVPCRNCQVVARVEYAHGIYFGRDDTNQRGSLADSYDDVRIGLSLGVSW